MAQQDDTKRLPHDPAFKAICSHPRMIADALRGYAVKPNGPLDPRTVAALDFCTLQKLPAEWVREDFHKRIGDQVWRVQFRWARDWDDPGGHLLLLVEFQSQQRRNMPLRMAGYAAQLYEELEVVGMARPGESRPPIFPMLIHNGPRRWTAPTKLSDMVAPPPAAAARPEDAEAARVAADLRDFQLNYSCWLLDFDPHREDGPDADNGMSLLIGVDSAATVEGLMRPLELLRDLPERELAGKMLEWGLRRLNVDKETAEEMKRMANVEERFYSQLDVRVREWTQQWLDEGREEGRTEGIQEGRTEGLRQGRTEGIETGIEQGRAEAITAQREGLRRQAAVRFGASARLLDRHLESVGSAAKLAEIGVWLMVDTMAQVIAKIEAAAADERID